MKKLVRMSLVAAVAVAGFTTSASAVEGLSVSGKFVVKVQADKTNIDTINYSKTLSKHDIDFDVKLNQKISDNLSGTVVIQADSKQNTNKNTSNQNVDISNAYFTYDQAGFNATLGLQDINTPVTDGEEGAGLLVTYSPFENVTLAAAHFLSNSIGDSDAVNDLSSTDYMNADKLAVAKGKVAVAKADISAVALIVSAGPVNMELWHVAVSGVNRTTSGSVSGSFGPLSASALYAVTSDETNANDVEDGDTVKITLDYAAGFADFRAAYFGTDKDGGAFASDTGAQTAIELDELSFSNVADVDAYLLGVTVPVSDFNLSLDYLSGDIGENSEATELLLGVSTKVAKTTTLSVGYSMVEFENGSETVLEQNIANFKVKYTF
ncbi:MAG: porin [Campylobacterales bacterium]|nr:porin [Campylobacterales bacterium]